MTLKHSFAILMLSSLLPFVGRGDTFYHEALGNGECRVTGHSGVSLNDVVIPPVIFDGINGLLVVTEVGDATIGTSSFKGDTMRTLTLPDALRKIDTYTFQNCTNLVSVDFGKGVTNIGGNAFHNCRSLTKLFIPASVNTLGGSVFARCSALKKIVYLGNAPTTATGCYIGTSTSLISYVCEGTTGWSSEGSTILPTLWPEDIEGNRRSIKKIAPTYTIKYLANGGKGTMAAQTCTYGKVDQLKASAFTKNGKKSIGWISSDNDRRYDNGMLIFNLAYPGETNTLKAIFGN